MQVGKNASTILSIQMFVLAFAVACDSEKRADDSHTLTIALSGEGTVVAAPASANGKYADGTVVTLTAAGSSGWRFLQWGDGTNANPLTVTMTNDIVVTAVFDEYAGGAVTYTIDFYASYAPIIDRYSDGIDVEQDSVVMSTNGGMLVGWGENENGDRYAFLVDRVGLDPHTWSIEQWDPPAGAAISADGLRAYVGTSGDPDGEGDCPILLQLTEVGSMELELREARDTNGIGGFAASDGTVLDVDADGTGVYMLLSDHQVWHCDESGLNFVNVINPEEYIELDGTTGLWINEFAINDGGGHVAFIMSRWDPPDSVEPVIQDDLMAWRATTQFTRMTADAEPRYGKGKVSITMDGALILYRATDLGWYIADFGGNSRIIPVAEIGYGGNAVGTGTLGMIFHANTQMSSAGGRLVRTDSTWQRLLFAGTSLDADGSLAMSVDGNFVAFVTSRTGTDTSFLGRGDDLYIGYLDARNPTIDAPRITEITMSADAIERDRDAELAIFVELEDKSEAPVCTVRGEILDDGIEFTDDVPADFFRTIRDDGEDPDRLAGDGIFSGWIRAANAMDTYAGAELTVRIGVELDEDGADPYYPRRACVADVTLPVLE